MDSIPHSKTNATHPEKHHHKPPSTSELLSSAKLVAEAAKATLHHEPDKVDKGKVSGAAADLLAAASHYGKLEGTGSGSYIEKAENYLHQYHSSHSTTTTSGHHSAAATTTTTSSTHSSSHSGGDDNSGSGYGDYLKMAQGFLKKN